MTNMLLAFFRVTQRASLLLAFLVLLAMILSSGAVYMLGGDLGSIQGDIDSGSRLLVAVCIVYAVSRIIGDFSKKPTANAGRSGGLAPRNAGSRRQNRQER